MNSIHQLIKSNTYDIETKTVSDAAMQVMDTSSLLDADNYDYVRHLVVGPRFLFGLQEFFTDHFVGICRSTTISSLGRR